MADSNIVTWYNSTREILITGVTGFLGKSLLEKILRSCRNVGTIYVLIRNKRNTTPEDRLTSLLNNPLFDTIKKENPNVFKKIKPVLGDIALPNLGLTTETQTILCKNVSVIFHSAATIRFNETLLTAINLNVIATQELLKLACNMKKLEAFVYISTAYSNCTLTEIDEIVYPSPIDLNKLLILIKNLDEDLLEYLTPKLLKKWPNTYSFTKALAESAVADYSKKLPIVIFRPSIITSSAVEPVPGWIDSLSGPTGFFLLGAKGLMRSILVNNKCRADLIPIDLVVNSLIAVAWKTATTTITKKVQVYNCTSGTLNPLFWGDVAQFTNKYIGQYPVHDLIWYPKCSFVNNTFRHKLQQFFFHFVPAILLDFVVLCFGRKPFLVRLQNKVENSMKCQRYFLLHEWKFHAKNYQNLKFSLNDADKTIFNCDIQQINWDSYFRDYTLGIKQFLLKDKMDDLEGARRKWKRLKYLHYGLIVSFWIGIILLIFVVSLTI